MSALLASLLALAAAAPPGWQAGFGKVAVTPTEPMWLSGYASRTAPAEGKETDLWARAVVLRAADGKTCVLVALDLVGIDRDLSANICKHIRMKHGLPREAVVLNCSHTHCGPVVGDTLRSMYALDAEQSARVARYTDRLPGLILEAVDAAVADLAPATLTWATGRADFAVNRRENKEADVPKLRAAGKLSGPTDHDVPILAVRAADGKLRGVVFGYACHATTLNYQKWNADYPGYAAAALESAHPGATALFVAGCGADQNPLPRRSVELAKGYGEKLAAAVEAVLAKPGTPLAAEWAGTYREIPLPYREVPTRETLLKDAESGDRYVAGRARHLLDKLAAGPLTDSYPYPAQTWKLGSLNFVALGGEVVVDYATRLKAELPAGQTWVAGYANDVMAYIPSERVLAEGGYEGAAAMVYYGLPSAWAAGVENRIVAEVRRQTTPENAYLAFVREQAAKLRANDKPPATLPEWEKERAALRDNLQAAWGPFPETPAPLEPQNHGELKRDGYRVEKITFQTFPGVRMTANAYVPDRPGKLPAVLCVHGHWKGAKQDPVVQARCIGLAKLGFVVLCVDAFGAGERGVGTALGEYHGEMTAATLLPVGRPLSGLQVYENGRAVDYLRTRPEVDGGRIGITGASGGGNQTMYAGGWDDRFKAVVPVCSVGNYQAYLGAACCMCEVVPGALSFTEEAGVLGLVAPRGLMVVSATKDARQFSVGEAKTSLARVAPVFKLYDKTNHVRHAVFESPHDYSKAMREAMYGWMTLHLKGEGDGSPIPEPEIKTEDPEALRCYPGTTRPADWVTIPKFAAAEGRKLLAAKAEPKTAAEWTAAAGKTRAALVEKVFGGFPKAGPVDVGEVFAAGGRMRRVQFSSEPGVTFDGRIDPPGGGVKRLVVFLNLDGAAKAAGRWRPADADTAFVPFDPRAVGGYAIPGDRIGRAPDHNSAEWALWLGRPLLGQWAFDVRRLLDALERADGKLPPEVVVIGEGPAGLVALAAAATDPRVTKAAAVGTLGSFVSDEPFAGQRLGTMAPGILREVGDVAHLAALAAPRKVVIAGGVTGGGRKLTAAELEAEYRPAVRVWKLLDIESGLLVTTGTDPSVVMKALR